jgi:hypothetical protein
MASLSGYLVAYLLYFASFCNASTAARRGKSCKAPVATVKNGSYAGVHSAGYNQDFFLGMPYATVSAPSCC